MFAKPHHLFFFGTLLDAKIRYGVLGRTLPPKWLRPATLAGYTRLYVQGRPYPMLKTHPTGRVPGLLVGNMSDRDRRLLDLYEGEEYVLSPIVVRLNGGRRMSALAYLCRPGIRASSKPWTPHQGVLRSRSFCQ